jgi:hypothetical protein
MTYNQSRSIKLAQATKAQKPASPNIAAQALCEPAPKDAAKLIANFESDLLSAISRHEISRTCGINHLAPIDSFTMEYLGS